MILARCEGAARTFGSGAAATVALQPTDCEVRAGDRIALVGPSGSGKSTLVHLLAGLDAPTVGTVHRDADPIGVVFQGPSLLDPLTVVENVELPLLLAGEDDARARALAALERLQLRDLAEKLPEEISGGQAQRVAVARALVRGPRMILADEPTGQLDHVSAERVIDVLLAAADHAGAALVVSTHDPVVAARLDTRWKMASGRLSLEVPTWPR
ncbi:ABC transporter ATP-binding protein [Solirubrobacter ginsenosidimutans]|uniref:ABC transporter ATP-binding protein n=1 Tax=Solirubrobacter ginsenosidimutans TaxID=490573 RepID=A0A9X3MS79_9ACTN|nr:ABC transporter ATP-binding protein [Solirubrobacter ginsenosidimutans]MDA0161649.1 ABC transporter ATP-binding protein [Solirubrobacter ginsenosidimutans]